MGTDAKVVCLPSAHRLARRRRIRTSDLHGEHFLDEPARRALTLEEKFENIAVGHGIAIVPRSVVTSYSRPDLVYVDVVDEEPAETCIAMAKGRRERRIRDFMALAVAMLASAPLKAAEWNHGPFRFSSPPRHLACEEKSIQRLGMSIQMASDRVRSGHTRDSTQVQSPAPDRQPVSVKFRPVTHKLWAALVL